MRTWIERVPVDRYFSHHLDDWKAMLRDGWNITVLIAPTHKHVVVLAWRDDDGRRGQGGGKARGDGG